MDPILNGYVQDYVEAHGINAKNEGEAFEHFSNHCIVARDFPGITDSTDVAIGGSQDTGIDGAAIFVNGVHIQDADTVDYLSTRTRIEVDFVFIQSKSGKRIKASEVGSFGEGVFSFFRNTGMQENEVIAELRALKDKVFRYSAKMSRRPSIHLFYCTATNFRGDTDIDSRAKSVSDRIRDLELFSNVQFTFLNREKLTTRYDEIRLKIEKEIVFDRHTVFPEIPDIRQAYIGLLQCGELLKLITNSDQELQRNLFSENIRDFLGKNKVNEEIRTTILSLSDKFKLPALNNGVTIVAKEITSIGNKFTLRDFQIVNGCQTSNIIYLNREHISPEMYVPVKIVEASNSDLVNEIVKSTNRQTQVTDEAFVALEDFHKQLEKFFASLKIEGAATLLYERRRNQYQDDQISPRQVITLTLLSKSFVACFLGEPHSTNRYYGELIESNRERIFQEQHSMWAYYTSAAIFYKMDILCRRQQKWLRNYRYQLCYMFLLRFGPPPAINNQQKMDQYCNRVLEALWDEDRFEKEFHQLAHKLENLLVGETKSYARNPPYRLREFTKKIEGVIST